MVTLETIMRLKNRFVRSSWLLLAVLLLVPQFLGSQDSSNDSEPAGPPTPLIENGHSVDWWFVFKFNAANFPSCPSESHQCPFGGSPQQSKPFSQQFVYASSDHDSLKQGNDCLGGSVADPVGATFDEVYSGSLYYVVWNDQFYKDPAIRGCSKSCGAPWGHSKGVIAWDSNGDGLVMQVTTPSWPAAGSIAHPRESDGNTLGCIKGDNNVQASQHFFALKLTKNDVIAVLQALGTANVATDISNLQIVRNGGPEEIQVEVQKLGVKVRTTDYKMTTLSSGVELISKPSGLHVPPWQFVSALLGGVSLRTATWWMRPAIPSTDPGPTIACWDDRLGKPGAVEIATTGEWDGTTLGLKGGPGKNFNHAKIGVSISGAQDIVVFGDMNQQGALSGNCASSQNGRGGLFFVVKDENLAKSVRELLQGDTAPTQ